MNTSDPCKNSVDKDIAGIYNETIAETGLLLARINLVLFRTGGFENGK
jgi:hypothetical protein